MENKENTVVTDEISAETVQKKVKVPFYKKKGLIIGVAAAIVIVVALWSIFGIYLMPKKLAMNFAITSVKNGDCSKYYAYDNKKNLLIIYDCDTEREFFDKMTDSLDQNIKSWNDYYKASIKENDSLLLENYGKYKLKAEVMKEKDLSFKKLEDEYSKLEVLQDRDLIDISDYDACKVITVMVEIDGKFDGDNLKEKVFLVKKGIIWKALGLIYDY